MQDKPEDIVASVVRTRSKEERERVMKGRLADGFVVVVARLDRALVGLRVLPS